MYEYICICICICTCIYIHTHTHTHTHMCSPVHVHTHVHPHTCVYIWWTSQQNWSTQQKNTVFGNGIPLSFKDRGGRGMGGVQESQSGKIENGFWWGGHRYECLPFWGPKKIQLDLWRIHMCDIAQPLRDAFTFLTDKMKLDSWRSHMCDMTGSLCGDASTFMTWRIDIWDMTP